MKFFTDIHQLNSRVEIDFSLHPSKKKRLAAINVEGIGTQVKSIDSNVEFKGINPEQVAKIFDKITIKVFTKAMKSFGEDIDLCHAQLPVRAFLQNKDQGSMKTKVDLMTSGDSIKIGQLYLELSKAGHEQKL